MRHKLSTILRFAISLGLLVVLIWIMHKDAKEVIAILKDANKALILLAILINLLLTIVLAYRLKLLMSGQKILVSLKDAVYLTFIGFFFNNFLPTAIGGDIAKAYYASKKTNNKIASYAAVFTDRLLGLMATLLIALAGLIFIGKNLNNKFIIWMVLIAFLLIAAMIIVLFKKHDIAEESVSKKKRFFGIIKDKLLKLYKAVNLYRNSPLLLCKAIGLSLMLQAGAIFSVYIFVLCIGSDIFLYRLFLIIPLIWAVSMLPSLNGLGVREGAFVYFLKGYIGPEKALAISILWLGLIMLYSIIGGLLQLLYPVKIKEEIL